MGKGEEIVAPVLPCVSSCGFGVFIWIVVAVEYLSEKAVLFIQEIIGSDGNPIEFESGLELGLQLVFHLPVNLRQRVAYGEENVVVIDFCGAIGG